MKFLEKIFESTEKYFEEGKPLANEMPALASGGTRAAAMATPGSAALASDLESAYRVASNGYKKYHKVHARRTSCIRIWN